MDYTELRGEIDRFGASDLQWVVSHRGRTCVSVYLPTHRHAPGTAQDPIRLRRLATEARRQLTDRGLRRAEADELLAPVDELIDDTDFWRYQADGLALFAAPQVFRRYRLPFTVEEQALVARSFTVRPLLPVLTGDGRFLVLALSQNGIRLYEGTRLTVSEIALEDVPANIGEALAHEDHEQQIQLHTTGSGEGAAMFHGHRGGEEDTKEALTRYFRAVDRGLAEQLTDEKAPLVVAGVGYYLPLFRSVSRYGHIADEAIEGAADQLEPAELHRRAWELLAPRFDADRRAAAGRYAELEGTGRTASGVEPVVVAAGQGRVDTLFVSSTGTVWGQRDEAAASVEIHGRREPDDDELLELATIDTLSTGGIAYALPADELPSDEPASALLRY